MTKAKKRAKEKKLNADPLEIEVKIERESEVTIGGDAYLVRIRSYAALDQVVAHAEHLYRTFPPPAPRRQEVGFAGAQIERRETDVPPGSATPYPAVLGFQPNSGVDR